VEAVMIRHLVFALPLDIHSRRFLELAYVALPTTT
jgi:hypothetical protein